MVVNVAAVSKAIAELMKEEEGEEEQEGEEEKGI